MKQQTAAENYVDNSIDLVDLMSILKLNGVTPEQFWQKGATVWAFVDGSYIRIEGTEVETGS